ncbi:MAG: DUF3426 domain-containing protein [Geobacteraceae bacterium]|nr:DUF3426 domain-containing protein [Geobacteraceae bacterium]
MIIQCEKCKTRFRLDDSRVSEAGVRVRCSRCSHTFVVRRDTPEEEPDFDTLLRGLGEETLADAGAGENERIDDTVDKGTEGEDTALPDQGEKGAAASADGPDVDDVSGTGEIEASSADASTPGFSGDETAPPAFGEGPATTAPEDGADSEFEARLDDAFRPHDDVTAPEATAADETEMFQPVTDDGDIAAETPEKSMEVRQSSTDGRPWPVADSRDEEPEEEQPPLCITSRRKKSPLIPLLAGGLCLVAALVAGFFLLRDRADDLRHLVPGAVQKTDIPFMVRAVEGVFVINRESGELFVMRGEVYNKSARPVGPIRVQGTVYGGDGAVIARKTVGHGNAISPEELSFRSYSGMEKAMSGKSGEAQSGIGVPPGKSVPFVIVFKDVPRSAVRFGAKIVDAAGGGDAVR